jgi:FMN-dependent NADH-azoreductase
MSHSMIVLHIDSSASPTASASRQLGAAAVEILRAGNENVRVKYRDLAASPPAHLDGELLRALRPLPGTQSQPATRVAAELRLTETLIDELLQADVLVLGAPMYNFSIPSPLKAWITAWRSRGARSAIPKRARWASPATRRR